LARSEKEGEKRLIILRGIGYRKGFYLNKGRKKGNQGESEQQRKRSPEGGKKVVGKKDGWRGQIPVSWEINQRS